MMSEQFTLWTIGHSTRSLNEFLELLGGQEIEALADVRRFPGSRKYPQYNQDALAVSLPEAGVDYSRFPELGGRRRPRPDSRNTVWRNESFQGYADYMETDAFRTGIERLAKLARKKRTAIMCSEAVWWRCHRSLIADYLKVRGAEVRHIMGVGQIAEHPYTSAARVVDGRLLYSDEG